MDAMPAQADAMLVTVAVAVAAGAMLMVIARKLETSAIGLLLLGGIALGPQALGFVQPDSLGRVLPVLVSLAVGLNTLLCERWRDRFGRDHLFRWGSAGSGDRLTAGLQVWAALPKPSVLSSELFHGEARVMQSLGAARHAGAHVWPLVAIADSGVVVDPDSPERLGSVEMLSLYREADYLQRAMRRELVVRLDVDSRPELYRELVKRVASLHPAVSIEATVDELLSRDENFPPAMGHGVAVPHAYSSALEARLVAVAQTPRGLDYRAHDGEPVRLVVLVLGPPGDPEGHLETVARIARLVGDPEMRQALADGEVPNGVLELVRGFCCE